MRFFSQHPQRVSEKDINVTLLFLALSTRTTQHETPTRHEIIVCKVPRDCHIRHDWHVRLVWRISTHAFRKIIIIYITIILYHDEIIKFLVQHLLHILIILFSDIIWHYYDDPSCTYGNSKRLIFCGIRLSIVVRYKNGDSVRKRNEWSYLTPDGEQRVNRRDSLRETHFCPGEREYFRTKATCRRSLWYKTFIDIRPREERMHVKDFKES